MSENYYDSGSSFQSPPVGNHAARLIKVVDIGTQKGEYQGKETIRRQEIWTWELPLELMEDGQPFITSKFYTASLGEKSNLYKDLTAWLGKPPDPTTFTPEQVLGKTCQIVVVQRENTDKRVVASVGALTKGVELPKKAHNPIVFFSLRPGKFDQEIFDNLSPRIQEMIAKSPEYAKIVGGGDDFAEASDEEVDIPF